MYLALMQMLVLVGGVSAAYWGVLTWVMKVAPRAAIRAGMANLVIVVGIWLSIQDVGHPNFVNCQVSDWLILGGLTLFRDAINHLANRHYRTPWTNWLPIGAEILLTATVTPSTENESWRAIVWSLTATWIALATYLESYRVMGAARFGLGARLAISWPFLAGGVALLYRTADTAINVILQIRTTAEQVQTENAFVWAMVSLLLILNYTLGMLAGIRLVMRIRDLAERDFLTGCQNRRSIEARLKLEIDRKRRFGVHLGCILFDLDYFKQINDNYGHDAGDAALRHAANVALGALRTVDAIGRFGGEEFLVLLPGTDLSGACESANRMRQLLTDNPLTYGGKSIPVTASFGVAALGINETLERLVKRADLAMYQAKHLGRNRVDFSADVE